MTMLRIVVVLLEVDGAAHLYGEVQCSEVPGEHGGRGHEDRVHAHPTRAQLTHRRGSRRRGEAWQVGEQQRGSTGKGVGGVGQAWLGRQGQVLQTQPGWQGSSQQP